MKIPSNGQDAYLSVLHEGPSEYIKNLVESLYVEGLDAPRHEFKMSTSPEFRRQSPHDKRKLTGPKVFSNDMKDCCKHKCRLCNKTYTLTAMRGHCKTFHHMSIKEYQHRYGNVRDMIELVMWHRCTLCNGEFLLDSDEIHKHANIKHNMSLREYTQKFLVLKNRGYVRKSDTLKTALIETLQQKMSPLEVKQEVDSYFVSSNVISSL